MADLCVPGVCLFLAFCLEVGDNQSSEAVASWQRLCLKFTSPCWRQAWQWQLVDGGVRPSCRSWTCEAISLLRFEHHHEGRAGIIAKASRNC